MIIDRKSIMAFILVSGVALGGCTPNDISIGTAVRNNKVAQIVEPDPKYTDPQVADGSQTANAQQRYRTGRVKPPKPVRTTQSTGNSN